MRSKILLIMGWNLSEMLESKLPRRLVKWIGLSRRVVTRLVIGSSGSMPARLKVISIPQHKDHKFHGRSILSPITKPNLSQKHSKAKR